MHIAGTTKELGDHAFARSTQLELIPLDDAGPEATPARTPAIERAVKPLLVALDLAMVGIAMFAAYRWRRMLGDAALAPAGEHALLAAMSVPVWLVSFAHYRLYNARHVASRLQEFSRLIHASAAAVLGTAVLGFSFRLYATRGWLALSFLLALFLLLIERELVRRAFSRLRRHGYFLRRVVIVGANIEAQALAKMLIERPSFGYTVVGFVDDLEPVGHAVVDGNLVLGRTPDALTVVERVNATGVIVAATAVDLDVSTWLTRHLTAAGVHVELSSSLRDVAAERLSVRGLGRFPIVYVEPVARDGWRVFAKRTFDVVVAAMLLAVTLPALALAAIAIKLDSRGPVLFRQRRVGRNGRQFEVFKLRTMVVDAESLTSMLIDLNEADGPLFKIQRDPRVTRVGRLLRTTCLDELPQLLNVVRGEMSLVGPRPALPSEVNAWTLELHERLVVRPGMTGMWQVRSSRRVSFEDYVRLDLFYVHNWSLWTDLAMLAKTVPTVLLRRGSG